MEAVLVTRTAPVGSAGPSTADYRLEITLGDSKPRDGVVTPLPHTEWPGAQNETHGDYVPTDWTYRPHSLARFSPFGSGNTNEFATWTMGRELFLSSPKLRESCEDDIRTFAERSDQTEGFMLTAPVSDGFGGLSCSFLEMLRDEFAKSTIFTTATMTDSSQWKRPDSDRSRAQRLLNTAFSLQHLEELSSMLLPLQPASSWDPESATWANYLREDLPMVDSYTNVLTMHLQSMNSELREVDGLTSIVNQLNWRGDNKIAHLSGASPLLPPHMLKGEAGLKYLKSSVHDFSAFPHSPPSDENLLPKKRIDKPFAQYSIVRGYEDEELQELGAILESATPLREPLSAWIALPEPYPILPTSSPTYRSLIPSGRPLIIAPPPHPEPFSPAGLFGLPSPHFPASLSKSYFVQPNSIPILTTLDTSTAARHLLRHLHLGIKELQRVRSGVLREYEEGEYGLGKEGIAECRERLETLADGLAVSGGIEEESDGEGQDEDEHFDVDNDTSDFE